MRRFLRREYAADWAAAGYAAVYYAWLATRTPGTATTLFVGDIAFYPLGLAVGLAYLRNARIRLLDGRTRLAWGILGAGSLTLWVIGNTWPRAITFFGASAFPGWVGVMEIVQHLLLIAAIAAFPAVSVAPRTRPRFVADLALILASGSVLTYLYGARASAAASPASPAGVAFAQSVMDWAVFVAAATGIITKRDTVTRRVLIWLLAANVLYLGANYVLSGMEVYRLGDNVDGLWFAAWCCRWTAARIGWHRYRAAGGEAPATGRSPVDDVWSGVFSYSLVGVTFAALAAEVAAGTADHLLGVTIAAGAIAFLLVARQLVELRERRRLYAARLRQEARFRSFVQHAPDIVVVADGRGTVVYASPSAARAFGPGAVVPGGTLNGLLPGETLRTLLPAPGAPPRAVRRETARVADAGGVHRELEIVATDMRDDPAVRGIVLNARDVTERNELERQLRAAQQIETVGLMAGGLAHDFNNVLTAIKGYTDLLRTDLPAGSAAADDLPHIDAAVDRAVGVTRKLMAFSRRREPQKTCLDVNAVLLDLQPLLHQTLPDRIEVELRCATGLWPVFADAGQLEQVVINLITNARDAMSHGGTLTIGTANVPAPANPSDSILPAGDAVAIEVSDRGTGIPASIRDRVFDPFFTTKAPDRGLGLGLAIVRSIVAQHDGAIAVRSVEGLGTTVTIFLPRCSPDASAPPDDTQANGGTA